MHKLVELLEKHLEYMFQIEQNKCRKPYTSEIFISLGKSVLINNMNVLDFNEDTQRAILKKYEAIFGTTSVNEVLLLNLNKTINPAEYDVFGRIYEAHIHNNGTRKISGQFYSPIQVVSYIVRKLNLDNVEKLIEKRFIDIACGTGVFLLFVFKEYSRVLRKKGLPEEDIIKAALKNIYGLDINQVSCIITKINLFIFSVLEFSPESILNVNDFDFNIYNTNSIENRLDIFESANAAIDYQIKQRLGIFETGFDYIIGNPPYLEAKKMPKDLKEVCKANYKDNIFGAFDLYIAFISQCNRLVADNGIISLILPNKFTVAKYAKKIREKLLNHYTLLDIVDLSEMDIFSKVDVYPIVLTYKNALPSEDHKVNTKMSVKNYMDLFNEDNTTYVSQKLYKQIGEMHTYFCLPKKGNFEEFFVNLFTNHEKIGKFLEFRSTVSFHKKGLREKYVRQAFDNVSDKHNIKKYLGGLSYSKRNEVGRFKIDWNEFYINYDNEELKSIGNPLPTIEIFERTKIIFCQHSKEITATYDELGEWVTKDVFPIAFAKDEIYKTDLSVKYLTGVLNSKLYSFIYGIIYKGIQIAQGYYHYLPTWISVLPVIVPPTEEIKEIERLVDEAMSNPNHIDLIMEKIDDKIFDIYSVNDEQREVIYSFFGYEKPALKC